MRNEQEHLRVRRNTHNLNDNIVHLHVCHARLPHTILATRLIPGSFNFLISLLFSVNADTPLAASDLAHRLICTRLLAKPTSVERKCCVPFADGSEHLKPNLLFITNFTPKARAPHRPHNLLFHLDSNLHLHVGTFLGSPSENLILLHITEAKACLSSLRSIAVLHVSSNRSGPPFWISTNFFSILCATAHTEP